MSNLKLKLVLKDLLLGDFSKARSQIEAIDDPSEELRLFGELSEKLESENWIKSNYSKIINNIQGYSNLTDLGETYLENVCESLQAQLAKLYSIDPDNATGLKLISSYGCSKGDAFDYINFGEGLIGQACKSKRPCHLQGQQVESIEIKFSLGVMHPQSVFVLPLMFENEVQGALEIASLQPLENFQTRLLEETSTILAISLKSILYNSNIAKLLAKHQVLADSLTSQKQALDSAAIVAETDTKGRITYVNNKFLEISKYNRDELLGQDHRIINSGQHPTEFFANLWMTIASGKVWHGEVCNRAKDGELYWVDTTIYPFKDSNQRITRYVAIRFDITSRKKAEAELRSASELTEKIAQSKVDLLSNISHDIRTPLGSILGYADLLLEEGFDSETTKSLETIKACGDHLKTLIDDFLDLSKIQSGKIVPRLGTVNLNQLLKTCESIFQPLADRKSLLFSVRPKGTIPDYLFTDGTRLKQILINLVGNAIKFTKEGQISLEVSSETIGDIDELTFAIKDTGIGIAKDKIDYIFGRFHRDDGQEILFAGSGLGLNISQSLVELLKGRISVESELGVGSTFTFVVPSQRNHITVVPSAPSETKVRRPEKTFRILVVDDIQMNRDLALRIVTKMGYRGIAVSSGKEALELLAKEHFELVLMDLRMPELNGYDATSQIMKLQEFKKKSYIVAFSANALSSDIQKCRDLGMHNFIAKPVSRPLLLQVIKDAIDYAKRQNDEAA